MDESYLDKIKRKKEEKERKAEEDSRTGEIVGAVVQQGAKSRTSTQSVKVENKDLAKSEDIDDVIKQLKEVQLAALLGGQQKPSVILADSTDLGEKIGELASLLGTVIKNTEPKEQAGLKTIADKVDALGKGISGLKTDKDLLAAVKKVGDAVGKLKLEAPTVNVPAPEVTVNEKGVDLAPLSTLLSEVRDAVNKIKLPKQDNTAVVDAVKSVQSSIEGLTFPTANYVLPFKTAAGAATQVTLQPDGSLPITASISTGDLATSANQTDGSQKTQIVDAGGEAATVTGGKLDVNATASLAGETLPVAGATTGVAVAIVDGSGNQITSFGGGTQYTEDAVAAANPVGTALNMVRNDARSGSLTTTDGDNIAARGTNSGELYVKHVDAIPVTQSGTWDEVGINDSGNSITVDNPILSVVGGGAEAAAQRVTIADDSTGVLSVDDNGASLTVDNPGLTELAAAINSNKVDVNIVTSDIASGGTSAADDADFTAGTTPGTPAMGVFESSPTSVTDGDMGVVGITTARRLKTSTTIDAAIPAGNNNIGDVDVASSVLPTGASTLAEQQSQTTHLATIAGDTTDIEAAVELIDDTVATLGTTTYTEASSKGLVVGAVRRDADTTLVDTTNEVAPLQVNAAGQLKTTLITSLPAGTAAIGKLAANTGVDIGDVDVTSVPADPFGVNADAASATGSISAKLRFIAGTGIPITGTVTVGSHAVTNAGAFVVQVDGNALTALQKIDDPVLVDDAVFTPATSSVSMAGFEADEASTDSVDEGDAGAARMTLDRKQIVTIQPHTTGGLSVFNGTSSDGGTALTSTAQVISAAAGQIYGWYIYNPNATAQFVQLYNTAQASVTVGTTAPLFMLTIPATSAANVNFVQGITFSNTGFSAAATSTAGGNGAPGTALDAVIFYK